MPYERDRIIDSLRIPRIRSRIENGSPRVASQTIVAPAVSIQEKRDNKVTLQTAFTERIS